MSFSVTALQLLNRVRRRRRMPDVGSIVETEDLMALDALNGAIEEVLSGSRWEFDQRRSQIRLKGRTTGGTIQTTDGSDAFTYRRTGMTSDEMVGDFVLRVIPTESTLTAETAFRVLRASGIVVSNSMQGTFSVEMGETANFLAGTDLDATLIYAEYMLPDTVRSVIRVTHQEQPLTLRSVDPTLEFEEIYPRPHYEFGEPEVVSVGGYDLPTYSSTSFPSSTPPPQLRMAVWPVPDDDYVLDYTYQYRHPELTDAASVLDGVPPSVVDKIVKIAAEDMKAYYEKDVESAMAMRRMTLSSLRDIHANHTGMFAERRPVGNWDGSRSRFRDVHGLIRGRTIGSDQL